MICKDNDTATRQVHLQVAEVWEETDRISRLGGAILILTETIIAILVAYRRR